MNSWAAAGLIVGISMVATALIFVMVSLLVFYLGALIGGVLSVFIILVVLFLILGVMLRI